MKKFRALALALGALVCSAAIFAEATTPEYLVQSVTGKVEREVSAGKWEAVTMGMKLGPATVINTGLNSTLVLKIGDRVLTVKAMQKGSVEKLTGGTASAKSGIKLGSKVAESDVTAGTEQGRSNISTASTRASEATEDLEWAEDQDQAGQEAVPEAPGTSGQTPAQ